MDSAAGSEVVPPQTRCTPSLFSPSVFLLQLMSVVCFSLLIRCVGLVEDTGACLRRCVDECSGGVAAVVLRSRWREESVETRPAPTSVGVFAVLLVLQPGDGQEVERS